MQGGAQESSSLVNITCLLLKLRILINRLGYSECQGHFRGKFQHGCQVRTEGEVTGNLLLCDLPLQSARRVAIGQLLLNTERAEALHKHTLYIILATAEYFPTCTKGEKLHFHEVVSVRH